MQRFKRFAGNKLMDVGKKIVAVGKNYEAHAKEMGATQTPSEPLLFLKPTSSYVREGGAIEVPSVCKVLHHEVELGVVIGRPATDVPVSLADKHIAGYVLALDMTARDIQDKAKKTGTPWTVAKGFDTFCPVSQYIPRSSMSDPDNVELWCKVDGVLKQKGNTKDMIFKIPELISYISSIMTLEEGDLICTGTPEGVGPVEPGQVITAGITGIVEMTFPVIRRQPAHTFDPDEEEAK